jgi:VWFA-related protein
MRVIFLSFPLLCCALISAPQSPAPAPEQATAEMQTHDTPATFRTKVNLVLVPVVVRDSQGRAIGTLKREDFQLYDKGKLQQITKFSVEKAGSHPPPAVEDSGAKELEEPKEAAPGRPLPVMAEKFTAYIFDDVHITFGDLAQARAAAQRHLASLQPAERAAIFTSSGQTMLEFTDDKAQLSETLLKISPRSRGTLAADCPPMTYYMADLIQNKNDPTALQAATNDAMGCMSLDPTDASQVQLARQTAQSAASRTINVGEMESRYSLEILRKAVRRISGMPGQRSLVLVSEGFLIPLLEDEVSLIVDAAIRAGVTVNVIDARGLYTSGAGAEASEVSWNADSTRIKQQYARDAAIVESNVLGELADGTNGVFFQNNNDMNAAFERTSAVPEYSYLIGFSPENLKLDGNYHALKVKIKEVKNLNVQARRGYYAPKHLANPAEEAKHEIEEALFSREVIQDIPSQIHTQFFKSGDFDAKLTVLAKVDVRQLHFRKVADRNDDDLTVVCGLFDRNGNFVTAGEKTIEMKLKDATLETRLNGGVTIKLTFDVKAASYVVRLVVRDAEGQMMSAQNGSVEIP